MVTNNGNLYFHTKIMKRKYFDIEIYLVGKLICINNLNTIILSFFTTSSPSLFEFSHRG
jgi:hypothetical protein